jgi:sugar/nucleoside kinase (ribokinase family)
MLAQLDQGVGIADAMSLAAAAAAIQVTRHGASAAIPNIHETKSSLTANLTKA